MKSVYLQNLIPEIYAGLRIDQALAKMFPEYSRSQIQQWISNGSVTLDTHVISSIKLKVKPNQLATIQATLEDKTHWDAQKIPLTIVYEDESLMVINKPAGLVVHPGAGNPSFTLVNALLHYAPHSATLPRAGLIHRLDKDTSGLLVIAKNLTCYTSLVKSMQERLIKREYEAIAEGQLISGGTINAPIGRHPTFRTRMAVTASGREAITHYRVLQRFRRYSHLKIELETGRTHQIRVHLAHIKHPILGDQTYGNKNTSAARLSEELKNYLQHFKRQALHASRLTLPHPVSQKLIVCEAPLPEDFQQLLALMTQDLKQHAN